MNPQVTRSRSLVRPVTMTVAWCGSALSLIAGLTTYFLATKDTSRIQIAAGSGEITDPIDFYGPLANAEAMSSLSVILIGVGILALVLCLLTTALLSQRPNTTIDADLDVLNADVPMPYPDAGPLDAEVATEAVTIDQAQPTSNSDAPEASPVVVESTEDSIDEEVEAEDTVEAIIEDEDEGREPKE